MASSRRGISTSLATVLVLAGAGGACWYAAQAAATFIEGRSARDVGLALKAEGHDWAQVQTDGLQVHLTGTAPTEVERFRAVTQAATAVDAGRIIDSMTVAAVDAMTPPDFKIELLGSDGGFSLIGLIPAATDRAAILRALPGAADKVSDLLESADYPVPPLWDEALRFGLQAARMTAQSKVSITPGQVHVAALADNREHQVRLEEALRSALPQGVVLDTQISAPRPVISPFVLRFVMDEAGARLEACTVEDDTGQQRIAAAARVAGMAERPDCTQGLGSPSPAWSDAAVAAIGAVGQLGRGQLTLSDASVGLVVPATVPRVRFEEVVARLEQALPGGFTLEAQLEAADTVAEAPIEFQATLAEGGELSMRGRIADAQMRHAVDSFARSRFEVAKTGLRNDPRVPGGWTVRVIAGLEAMAALQSGQVHVTPDLVALSGVSGDPAASDQAAALLTERLGVGAAYELAIAYDRRLDATLGLPDGEECTAQLNLIMSESDIGFEPNRSSIAGDPAPTMARLAEVMTECAEFQIEAGGHTDSQGSEGFNANLSRGRAQAIVTAMQQAGMDVTNLSARGYGESQPVATNDTDEGREANRRIEFRLLSTHPVRAEPLPAPVTIRGVTGDAAGAAPEPQAGPDMAVLEAARMQGPHLPQVQGPQMPVTATAPALPPMQGPQLPHSTNAAGMVPMTVGVREEFQSLDEREENLRVPVLDADETTPRPGTRPARVGTRAAAETETTPE